jgi:glyoxylate/hydroxypyruvate reductase A
MALLVLMPDRDATDLVAALRNAQSDVDLRVWPECGDVADVKFAVSWNHPHGELLRFPNLEVVSSFGAAVDHFLDDPSYPAGVVTVRVVDPDLERDMAEYVLCAILAHRRHWTWYHDRKKEAQWKPRSYTRSGTVLVLGLGRLGVATARLLASMGMEVIGWSRASKELPGVRCIVGRAELHGALPYADVVVCMLPLTPDTAGILDAEVFARFRRGAYLVSVGRGRHLVESDLLDALADGRLSGACLDVFATEPLPSDHPFWDHPAITITPHVASLTNPASVAEQIADNYRRMSSGEELLNRVDLGRGY